jgi:transposase
VLRVFQTRDHLSIMGGITRRGQLFTLTRDEALTGVESVRFIKHLQYWLGPRLLAIWDGAPIHRGEEVQRFLADGGAKSVHLEQLPGYAPDLNPTEGVWELLKDVEMGNLCCSDFSHLHHELILAIRRLRRKPHLIQACFPGAGLAL